MCPKPLENWFSLTVKEGESHLLLFEDSPVEHWCMASFFPMLFP